MLTHRGVWVLAGAVLMVLAGRLFGVAELYALAVTAAALVGLAALVVRASTARISVRRMIAQQRVAAGDEIDVLLELRNDAAFTSPVLLVEDHLPAIGQNRPAEPSAVRPAGPGGEAARFTAPGVAPGKVLQLQYRLALPLRGHYRIGPLALRVRDPFGIAQRVRRYTATDDLVVHPRIEAMPERRLRGAHQGSGGGDTHRLFNSGDEFYTMREYVQGDDLRLVHWPSTAHRRTLMIRQQEQPWRSQATILLDLRRSAHRGAGLGSTLEKAVSAAASVAWHLTARGYDVRCVTDGHRLRPPVEDLATILDRLAVAEASRSTGLGAIATRVRGIEGLLVAVIGVAPGRDPVGSSPDLRALLVAGRGYSERVALVCTTAPPDQRSAAMAHALRSAGWKAATVTPRERLGDRWGAAVAAVTARRTARAGVGR